MLDYTDQNRRQGEEMLQALESIGSRPRRVREGQYIAICPFHDDHRPSLSLKSTDGCFYCFACGVSGTYWDFRAALDEKGYEGFAFSRNRSHTQRVRRMLTKRDSVKELSVDLEKVRECHRQIIQFWHETLLSEPSYIKLVHSAFCHRFKKTVYQQGAESQVAEYMYESPCFSRQTLESFHVGFAPPSSVELLQILRKNGFSNETIIATGLFQKHGNNGMISSMAGRVVYPSLQKNAPRYVTGRITELTPNNLSHSKYCNQRTRDDRTAFPMSRPSVFNEDVMKGSSDVVLITEGITDAIKATEASIPAVALGSTAFQKESLDEIASLLEEKVVIVCFDSEESGIGSAAMEKASQALASRNVYVRCLKLPMPVGNRTKTDACSFILDYGSDAFHGLLEEQTGVTLRSCPECTTLNISAFLLGKETMEKLDQLECKIAVEHIFA